MKKIDKIGLIIILISCIITISGFFIKHNTSMKNNKYYIIEIDGCEYIRYDGFGTYEFTHKGNCKNPIHYENRNKNEEYER